MKTMSFPKPHLVGALEGFVDRRGEIRDLLRDCQLDSVTLIKTKSGAVRGNHYHAQTTQWIFIVWGRLRVVTQIPGQAAQEAIYESGDFFVDPPGQRHAWQALAATTCLVLTQGPRSGLNYESDTFRLAEAERLI